jgi:hypothetical protein
MAGEMAEEQTTRRDQGPIAGIDASSFVPARRAVTRRSPQALHVCPACASELVYPTDWAPADRTRWSVELRCPDCEWNGAGVYAQEVVDRFDEALDGGTEQLLADLTTLTRANMEEQLQRFVDALWADDILPEDF